MANLSDVIPVIDDMFLVIGALITGVVNLLTGDLLVLSVVVAIVGVIIGIIVLILQLVKRTTSQSVKMKK